MIEDLFFENESEEKDLVKEDQTVIKHLCFSAKGKAEGCEDCNIKRLEFCEKMINILAKQKLLYSIEQDTVNDIISQVIAGIQKNITFCRGGHEAQFANFVRSIVRFKRADYFRKFYQKTPNFTGSDLNANLGSTSAGKIIELPLEEYEDKLKISPDFEEKIYVSQVLSALKEMDIECYNLYLKLYKGFGDRKTQKEIAEELGLKPNTLNKRLERCREKVLEELKKGKLI